MFGLRHAVFRIQGTNVRAMVDSRKAKSKKRCLSWVCQNQAKKLETSCNVECQPTMADLHVRATARVPASLRTRNVTGFETRSMSRLFRLLFDLVLVPGPLFHPPSHPE